MDNSSSSSKELTAASHEESSWTSYFEEYFLASQDYKPEALNGDDRSGGVGGSSSSMVSDAASYFAWTLEARVEPSNGSRTLSFNKKNKGKQSLRDDSLEDTASSPVSCSPKMIEWTHLEMKNTKEKEDNREISKEEDHGCNNSTVNEIHDHGASVSERRYECNELRKRGLCLVPLSMLLDYLG
uniref:Uncharacterized protein n=1 Tax=Ananas comosus var. bracteatus TaxID=296719 RepID=A0A6V7NXF4_ANACO|nr:unnamed protein product [Ananas comosus var. bracteatus]